MMAAERNGPTRLDKALTALRKSTAEGDEKLGPDHGSSRLGSASEPSLDAMETDLPSIVRRTTHVVRDGSTPKSHARHLLHHMPDLKDAHVKRMGETQAWAAMLRLMREGSPSLAMLQPAERSSPFPSFASLPVDPARRLPSFASVSVDPARPTKQTPPEDGARHPSRPLALQAMDRFNPNAPMAPSVDLLAGLQVKPQTTMVGPALAAHHQESAPKQMTSDNLAAALRPMVERWIKDTMPSVLEQAIRLETKAGRNSDT